MGVTRSAAMVSGVKGDLSTTHGCALGWWKTCKTVHVRLYWRENWVSFSQTQQIPEFAIHGNKQNCLLQGTMKSLENKCQ